MEAAVICSGVFFVTVLCIFFNELSTWLRKKLQRSVQCWFCHVGCRVKYIDSNSWTCSSCGQYNGFSKDGGYNKVIPGHYDGRFNISVTMLGRSRTDFKRGNTLCTQCNYYQELKVKQLASFVPISEANYDKEIEHYKLQLEESYKLCHKCEQLVANVISSQKYVLSGPRRLANLTKRIIFKSCWTLYASMLLSLLVIANRVPSVAILPLDSIPVEGTLGLRFADPLTNQILAGLGVVLHTLQCCQFGTNWSFVNWLVWAAMASSPHFLHNQLPEHISYVQMAISVSLFMSSSIILLRRKKQELAARTKDDLRQERRKKENSFATWTSISNKSPRYEYDNSTEKRRPESPVQLSPNTTTIKSDARICDKGSLLKPVARLPDEMRKCNDLDISTLSIGSKVDNPFTKATFGRGDAWERETITRSSGVSSLRSSPVGGWRTNRTSRGSPECSWSKASILSPGLAASDGDWTKCQASPKEMNVRRRNDPWTPMSTYDYNPQDWEMKKNPWPMQVYSYPVAYTWPGVNPTWDQQTDRSLSSSTPIRHNDAHTDKTNTSLLSLLPTIILAVTNAFLVYYIVYIKA